MSKPNEQYVIYMEEMIATQGWRMFVKECEKEIYHIQADALEMPTWEAVLQARGRAEQLAETVALEQMVDNLRERLLEPEEEDDADIPF